MRKSFLIGVFVVVWMALGGCATSTSSDSLQITPPVVRPKPLAVTPASSGSLFPAALATGVPRPLFEDRRARSVGDILQVEFNERTVANRRVSFSGSGDSSARNVFTGFIMVMVTQVLSNGNLVISGEKQIAIGAEEEVIRFSGIINPTDLKLNSVKSTMVADARLEYRGRGVGDDATRPGLLTRGLIKFWPF
ncbi:MAG: flagellar basal body L-ring protein FlgH [Betaproteobacteria bacterium]|nr:flagellar basal body L-ring protein FlgH [Betaproteobacteria bacterium]